MYYLLLGIRYYDLNYDNKCNKFTRISVCNLFIQQIIFSNGGIYHHGFSLAVSTGLKSSLISDKDTRFKLLEP